MGWLCGCGARRFDADADAAVRETEPSMGPQPLKRVHFSCDGSAQPSFENGGLHSPFRCALTPSYSTHKNEGFLKGALLDWRSMISHACLPSLTQQSLMTPLCIMFEFMLKHTHTYTCDLHLCKLLYTLESFLCGKLIDSGYDGDVRGFLSKYKHNIHSTFQFW